MRFIKRDPPRQFEVGNNVKFKMNDCGSLDLEPNEQVTFVTELGAEYDVARKDWGFYATPSLNGRLPQFGLNPVLVRNKITGRYFVMLVEKGKHNSFKEYVKEECLEVILWMNDTQELDQFVEGKY